MDKKQGDKGTASARDGADAAAGKLDASAIGEASEQAQTSASATPSSSALIRRLLALAATVVIAAALGAIAGPFATAELGLLSSIGASAETADAGALRDSIDSIDVQLSSLRAAVDTSGRSANAQLVKLGDRVERLEQGERPARTAKLSDTPYRGASAPDRDITGSIGGTSTVAAHPARPPAIEGWTLRRVINGAAVLQGRVGLVQVLPGESLPDLGRVESIKRQGNHWVVVTSRGMIVSRWTMHP